MFVKGISNRRKGRRNRLFAVISSLNRIITVVEMTAENISGTCSTHGRDKESIHSFTAYMSTEECGWSN